MVTRDMFLLHLRHRHVGKNSKHRKCRLKDAKSTDLEFILATSYQRKQNMFTKNSDFKKIDELS